MKFDDSNAKNEGLRPWLSSLYINGITETTSVEVGHVKESA
jgi:hypothetical protein